ncbi:GPI alpha-1,4-mannosyltransferase I, stabilizing subunit isoform X2 [Phalacrocorax aristotelis]|uniref:GPI alpha-1,4-mannosyltransferase I, stabilizing subunit isoform X2 n=1 Tax=Phalacrocorax aristotelis TaxID=126867 RepID=UPI003F4B6C04
MAGGPRWWRRRGEGLLGAGLAALLCALHVQAACRDTTVMQELLKEGFHRDLLVRAELGVGEDAGRCAVAARTRLPPGIYVDPYELMSLQQQNLTKAVLTPDVIDVEAPEYLATDLLVLLYMKPDPRCSRCFRATLPVHGRYHRPAEESEEVLVVLKSPEVLICCCDSEILVTCSFEEGGITAGNPEIGNWVACWQSVGSLLKWKLPVQAKLVAPVSGTA